MSNSRFSPAPFSLQRTLLAVMAAGALFARPSLADPGAPADSQKKDSTVSAAPSAAPASGTPASETTIGGYGEFGYNNYGMSSGRNLADMKRFVLFLGHRFSEQLSFNSEVEWEHAVTSADDHGESEIEQVYLNYQFSRGLNLKAGLFLMPFGFINQSHEPPVFYGVERNEVETRIIPSTWREGGLGLSGGTEFGLDWDAGITTGFDLAKFDDPSAPLRSIHQELQLAKADDPALYGSVNYRGLPGFTVGASLFTGKSIQGNADFKADTAKPNFSGLSGRVTLLDFHSRWQAKGWDLQGIFARGTIGDADKIDATLLAFNTARAADLPFVPDAFQGWLVQGSYTFWVHGDITLSPFARFEKFDTQKEMPEGFSADPANADKVMTVGLSFKPHTQVVAKADYQKFSDNTVGDRFNLGLGYMF